MIFKNVFVYTPFLPPNKSSAALRGDQLLCFAKAKFNHVDSICDKSLYIPFPNNKDNKYIRLIKEFFCGFELFLRVLFSKHNYYIFSSPPFFPALLGATAASIKGSPFLFDIRDLYPQVFVAYNLVSTQNIIYKCLITWVNFVYKKAHTVTTVTSSLALRVEEQSGVKPLLARNGYDDDIISGEAKKGKFSCIYHGNLGQFQRVDLIIELAKNLPGIDFYVAGDGPKRDLFDSIPTNLKYLGHISRNKVLKLLSQCHIGLSFLDDSQVGADSFPVKVYEFLGAGIPVVTTPLGEVSEELHRHNLGQGFMASDLEGIIHYISKVANDKKCHQNLLQNVHAVKNSYSRLNSTKILETQVFDIR